MTERSLVYGSFSLERTYRASPSKVFSAWADPSIKARWFGDPSSPSQIFEFREGGREYAAGGAPNGQSYTFDVRYTDIVPDNRIVYTYEMTLNGARISASLAYVELFAAGSGTRMVVTEHGVFLDGLDNSAQREEGTIQLLDAFGAVVEAL